MEIYIIGIGPGAPDTLTLQAHKALQKADAIFGAQRVLDALGQYPGRHFAVYKPAEVQAVLQQHADFACVCIAFGGDIGFYSGAKAMYEHLKGHHVHAICGVSSVQYLASKLHAPWQGWHLVSAHGVHYDALGAVRTHAQTFFLTGRESTPQHICQQLAQAGFGNCTAVVGENLSYETENIRTLCVSQAAQQTFAPLSVLLVNNPLADEQAVTPGLDDDSFLRGSVPMTKQEVRSICLSRLQIRQKDILWDIGAGTGSCTVEMALQAGSGHVYAVEKNEQAVLLIQQNLQKFAIGNASVVPGQAPQVLQSLPKPDGVFIGGSAGQMRAILQAALQKNSRVRVVINCIALQSLAQTLICLQELGFADVNITQVGISRAKKLGEYHMLQANNPVFVISARGAQYE